MNSTPADSKARLNELQCRGNDAIAALEPEPVCAGFITLPLQHYFGFFSRWRLHRRTPGPPPFSSMNSMLARNLL
jgi:hypothetical protein